MASSTGSHVVTMPTPLRYADIAGGRHLITMHGTAQVQLIPAGRAQLVTALNQAHRTLPAVARR